MYGLGTNEDMARHGIQRTDLVLNVHMYLSYVLVCSSFPVDGSLSQNLEI